MKCNRSLGDVLAIAEFPTGFYIEQVDGETGAFVSTICGPFSVYSEAAAARRDMLDSVRLHTAGEHDHQSSA